VSRKKVIGFWILEEGDLASESTLWILDFRFWILDFGFWIREAYVGIWIVGSDVPEGVRLCQLE
jgi:hypothetical protein